MAPPRLDRRRIAASLGLLTLLMPRVADAGLTPREFHRVMEQLANGVETRKRLGRQMVAYDVVFRRDPMRPILDAQGAVLSPAGLHDELSVPEIVWSGPHPLAVIEGEVFAPGDAVGPYTILDIKANGVVAQRANEMLFIPLDGHPSGASPPPQPAAEPPAAPSAPVCLSPSGSAAFPAPEHASVPPSAAPAAPTAPTSTSAQPASGPSGQSL